MAEQSQQSQFIIHKIFTKDLSFESPNSPDAFAQEWNPDANVDLNMNHHRIDDNNYEVELILTVNAQNQSTNAFLIEITQSGVFTIPNVEGEQLDHMLKSFCPTILFPYARETINSLIIKGGFPQLNISPVNFDAIYMQQKEQQKDENEPKQH
jgi:preprotein translocase subunit SecB